MPDDEAGTSRTEEIDDPQARTRLMNRDFVLLWQGQLVSVMGTQAFSIAMMFWLMETTGSASLMGGVMMLGTLPGVLLGPVAGTLADRMPRKRILVVCDLASGFVLLALATLFVVDESPQSALVGALFATALVVGALQAFFRPAAAAAIPDLVPTPKVAAANSMTQGSAQLAVILGQSLGGLLYGALGAALLFAFDGLSYLFSGASESFIRLPRSHREVPAEEGARHFKSDLVEGLRYVWRNEGMRHFLVLAAVVNFAAMPILVLLPFLVTEALSLGASWYGFLLAGFGAGALVGYALAGAWKMPPRTRSAVLVSTLLGTGLLLAALGWVDSGWTALATLAAIGVLNGFFNILLATAFQLSAPASLRGRVMGVVTTVAMAVAPLGMAVGGLLGDLTGKNLPLIYGACGSMITLSTLLLGWRRSVRDFLAFD